MERLLRTLALSVFLRNYVTCSLESNCHRKDSESCQHVGSLKGLIYMMDSVSSALSDMISSAKFRAENVEDGFCIGPRISNCSAISSTDESDHSVRAESDCKYLFDLGFKENGPYRIWPKFLNHSLIVYCDMETDGGGWTVIQRRGEFGEPHINFYRNWEEYKKGFGDIQKEFWLGNNIIFAMTNEAKTLLRIELEDFDEEKRFAKYRDFLVRSEIENFKMTIGEYQGTGGDALRSHNEKDFSTKDRGNDCPKQFKGAWWYAQCHEANLNGLYHHGNHSTFADGINWYQFRGHHHSMKVAEMKIKRCDC